MKNTILNQWKAFAFVAVITLFTSLSLCYSQQVLETRDGKAELKIQKFESVKSIAEGIQMNEAGIYTSDNSDGLQIDTVKGTPDEKMVKSPNYDPSNKENKIKALDSTKYTMFGDLLRDDPVYSPKYPLWRPIVGVLGVHVALGLFNRYVSNADFARVGFNVWSDNLKNGWEWDTDRFGMNFLGHPYSGALNYMTAHANGYSYWASLGFAVGGSFIWEYFGENTKPAYNDIVNTPVSGAFYGEILYRLSSNLLDDRTSGTERFFREFGAAIISPTRFVNRLVQGKLTSTTTEEVYQKEPLNIEISGGIRKLNDGKEFWTGPQNTMFNLQLDYGYPFEKREWKPFDYFKIRIGVNLGVGRKILENVTGYGVLLGKNVQSGKLDMLIGMFQHYNYFDNRLFELGTITFGGGIMSKYPVSDHSYVFTNFHLGIVPLAGNSTRFGPDTTQVRDYNYGGGLQTKIESGLNLSWASIQLIAYYFWIHTYVGATGNNFIGILRPRITVRLYRNLNIGFEQMVYYSDRYTAAFGNFHVVRTEQRIYLMLNVGNFKL